MAKLENAALKQSNKLTLSYIQKLPIQELTQLFASISKQFASRLDDCKEVEDLKTLQTYLHLLGEEISVRNASL
jgi:hypothetical protein